MNKTLKNKNEVKTNTDNLEKAIEGLDQFTKNWCVNVAETEKGNLTFRCGVCEFRTENGICLIKEFAKNHKCNVDLSDFGSMGSH